MLHGMLFINICFAILLFMVSAFYFVIAWNVIYLTFFPHANFIVLLVVLLVA